MTIRRRKGLLQQRHALPQVQPQAVGLGRPTIMDRTLAAQFGIAYVHLAVFAIDVDRVFMATEDELELPFGWEVLLCLAYLLGADGSVPEGRDALLEETCSHILAFAPGDAPLGSQLAFAVYLGVESGVLSAALRPAFHSWKKRPKQLLLAAGHFLANPQEQLAQLARSCLAIALQPPLAPPTVEALQSMATGAWALQLEKPVEEAETERD